MTSAFGRAWTRVRGPGSPSVLQIISGRTLALLLVGLLACASPVSDDPRPEIRARLRALASRTTGVGVPERAAAEELLLLGWHPQACVALGRRLAEREGEEEDWRLLLLGGARSAAKACLLEAEGDRLAAWGAARPEWRGAHAEWAAMRGRLEEAQALLGAPGQDPARLRVALARSDGAAALDAAEGAVVADPRDVAACRILARLALDQGDAAWAIEQADCGGLGSRAPELGRLRAEALDISGEYGMAEQEYARVGASVHQAALLYQEDPTAERRAAAARILGEGPDRDAPQAALHRVWMALMAGASAPAQGLDGSVPATLARALTRRSQADEDALSAIPGSAAAVVLARLAGDRGDLPRMEEALAAALGAEPARSAVHRARVALRIAHGGDVAGALAGWAGQDPDHVAQVGARGPRDVPWHVIVPERWEDLAKIHPDPRIRADAPVGTDSVGAQWRAAQALSGSGRMDALAELAARVPGLDALTAERYRHAPLPAGLPNRDP